MDPDDRTPSAIRSAGAEVITYGAPILPGAMFMLARIGDVPVLGLPGCVMYYRASIFDLVVPRLLSGEDVTRDDILALGYGGFLRGMRHVSLSRLRLWQGDVVPSSPRRPSCRTHLAHTPQDPPATDPPQMTARPPSRAKEADERTQEGPAP